MTLNEMGFDNFGYVFLCYTGVPNAFGIDHDGGAVFALVEATGFVGTHTVFEAARRQFFFEGQLQFTQAVRVAAAARGVSRTLIGANEDVSFELRHTIC